MKQKTSNAPKSKPHSKNQHKSQPKSKTEAQPGNRAVTRADSQAEPKTPKILRKRGRPTESEGQTGTVGFSDLKLAEPLQRALSDSGYTTPTPVQGMTIPATMSGRDVLGIAQTGTGKTAAFALPIIHRLIENAQRPRPQGGPAPRKGRRRTRRAPAFLPRALILSPTRELATQIAKSFETYAAHTDLRHVAIFGGVSQFRQEQSLERGADIVVATPGRLIDLMDQGIMDFSGVTTLVLDEADRMLDMGFIKPIQSIAEALPDRRQTLLFSATMPPAIASLAESLLSDPVRVEVPAEEQNIPKIEQSVMMITAEEKVPMLERLLCQPGVDRAVVFTKTKHGADRLCKKLAASDIESVSIHGNKSQAQRDRALDAFRRGRSRVLVATDVAARGLDVTGVTHVFNYDLPLDPEAYVHRIGRTGRAGKAGVAVAFCTKQERGLLKAIERQIGERINGSESGGHSGGKPGGRTNGAARPPRQPRRDDSADDSRTAGSRTGSSRTGGLRTAGSRTGGSHTGDARRGDKKAASPRTGSKRPSKNAAKRTRKANAGTSGGRGSNTPGPSTTPRKRKVHRKGQGSKVQGGKAQGGGVRAGRPSGGR